MQVTPLEAQDLLGHLRSQGLWTAELRAQLLSTVERFRLDRGLGNGRRSFIRRTYDCPFFAGGALGCTVPAEVKPYGCLGFNAQTGGVRQGEDCTSDQGLLARQAERIAGVEHTVGRAWTKLPLPLALLEEAVIADR